MKRTPIVFQPELFPQEFHGLLQAAPLFDSSCSPVARVYYADRDGGLYLKSAPAGSLKQEAEMDAFFHSLGLGPEVLAYHSADRDWLLTRAVPGEDCLAPMYISDPKRLCKTMAQALRHLHSQPTQDCPVPDHTARYLARADENCRNGHYDASLFPDNWGYASAAEARAVLESNGKYLKTDTLLHGDFCLPNIMLKDWKLSGFIDLGGGGVGDKHIDLFWGAWTLNFNLKDARWSSYFLDAYGWEDVEEELLRTVAAAEVFL